MKRYVRPRVHFCFWVIINDHPWVLGRGFPKVVLVRHVCKVILCDKVGYVCMM